MEPYFETGNIKLYHADCREVFPLLGKDSVDLIVTDPPYGQGFNSGWAKGRFGEIVGDDGSLCVEEVMNAACTCLKSYRHVYLFGGPYDLSNTTMTAKVSLIWDKQMPGMGDLTLPWALSHEHITFAVHIPSAASRKKGRGNLSARLRKNSVLRVTRLPSARRHPTEKPVEVMRQLIESSSMLYETVLDPFVGAGSTLEACILEDRKGIGIEIEEKYCEVTAKRLRDL